MVSSENKQALKKKKKGKEVLLWEVKVVLVSSVSAFVSLWLTNRCMHEIWNKDRTDLPTRSSLLVIGSLSPRSVNQSPLILALTKQGTTQWRMGGNLYPASFCGTLKVLSKYKHLKKFLHWSQQHFCIYELSLIRVHLCFTFSCILPYFVSHYFPNVGWISYILSNHTV